MYELGSGVLKYFVHIGFGRIQLFVCILIPMVFQHLKNIRIDVFIKNYSIEYKNYIFEKMLRKINIYEYVKSSKIMKYKFQPNWLNITVHYNIIILFYSTLYYRNGLGQKKMGRGCRFRKALGKLDLMTFIFINFFLILHFNETY